MAVDPLTAKLIAQAALKVATDEGVIFTDGATEVVYFNQLDEHWADEPYGSDKIGTHACGPTAMSIVVSSLAGETVDPAPHGAVAGGPYR